MFSVLKSEWLLIIISVFSIQRSLASASSSAVIGSRGLTHGAATLREDDLQHKGKHLNLQVRIK